MRFLFLQKILLSECSELEILEKRIIKIAYKLHLYYNMNSLSHIKIINNMKKRNEIKSDT